MYLIYVKLCKICIIFNFIFEIYCDILFGVCNKYFIVIYSKYFLKFFFGSEYIMKKDNESYCLCVWD